MTIGAEIRRERAQLREAATQRVEAWLERWGERLTSECEEVQAEIRTEATDRYVADDRIGWQGPHLVERPGRAPRQHPGDTEVCRMRVVCRHRVRRYGELPEGDEWMRQVNEIRRGLGMPMLGEARHHEAPEEPSHDGSKPVPLFVWVLPDGRKVSSPVCPPRAVSLREWQQRQAERAA